MEKTINNKLSNELKINSINIVTHRGHFSHKERNTFLGIFNYYTTEEKEYGNEENKTLYIDIENNNGCIEILKIINCVYVESIIINKKTTVRGIFRNFRDGISFDPLNFIPAARWTSPGDKTSKNTLDDPDFFIKYDDKLQKYYEVEGKDKIVSNYNFLKKEIKNYFIKNPQDIQYFQ